MKSRLFNRRSQSERRQDSSLILCLLCFLLFSFPALPAPPQLAWETRYNNSLSNRIHEAVAMALDSAGNVFVAGASQSATSDSDYVTIKYSPAGTELWARRFATAADDRPEALVVDHADDVVVTGSAGTVKYSSTGELAWTAPYAGRHLAVDSSNNVIVTGFSNNDFATAKLNATGSNLWTRIHGFFVNFTDISERVATDSVGNVFVAGRSADFRDRWNEYFDIVTVKYDLAGSLLWTSRFHYGHQPANVRGIGTDNAGDVYVAGNLPGYFSYGGLKYRSSDGSNLWAYGQQNAADMRAAAVDSNGSMYLTGERAKAFIGYEYATFRLSQSGILLWERRYSNGPSFQQCANAIALDNGDKPIVTGRSPSGANHIDIATVKYDTNGNQLWVKRYNGVGNRNDEGTALAVDTLGNIYVAGSSQNAQGGTDILLLKYVELAQIQVLTNHHVLLQFIGTPSQSYRFQATTNFPDWTDLGTVTADSNGVYRIEDTNAPALPYRFYRSVSP